MINMRDLPYRYKVWSKTFAKHLYNQARHIIREQYEENKTYNLDALYSNQKQVDNELRKGRITPEEHEDLTIRYLALKTKIEEENKV